MSVLRLYQGLATAAGPLIDAYLARRLRQGKEDAARLPERRGQSVLPRPAGALIWPRHATSSYRWTGRHGSPGSSTIGAPIWHCGWNRNCGRH